MAKWSMDLSKYAENAKKKIKDVRGGFVFYLYSAIARRTPVDTGRARGNWNVSVGSVDGSVDELARGIKTSIPTASGDESYFIANNVEYIGRLEFGGSKQAPKGMVGVTVANAGKYLEQAIRDADK